jgi:DNA mismatch repair protein MutL
MARIAKVALALFDNGRTALEVPPDRDSFARARALLGPRLAGRLIPVTDEENGIRVTAYLGAPDLAQTSVRGVQLFFGRRPVRDRGLLHALAMGYGELVPRGRYPVAVVLLDIPAGAVDVNVHPQKTEVRFADPAADPAAVRHIVQAGVASAPWGAESDATPVHMSASVAPPALPLDGRDATPLAQRNARDLGARAGQAQLAFAPPPPSLSRSPSPSPSPRSPSSSSTSPSPRAWVQQVRQSMPTAARPWRPSAASSAASTAPSSKPRAAAADPAWGTRAAAPRGTAAARIVQLSVMAGAPPPAPGPGPARSEPAVPEPAGSASEAAAAFAPAPARWGTDPGLAFDEALAAAARASASSAPLPRSPATPSCAPATGSPSGEVEALLRALDNVDLQAPTPHGRATLLRLPRRNRPPLRPLRQERYALQGGSVRERSIAVIPDPTSSEKIRDIREL